MVCPKCKNNYCKMTSEITSTGKDYSVGKGLCGEMLLGPAGFICGFSESRKTSVDAFWVCPKCGYRFKA